MSALIDDNGPALGEDDDDERIEGNRVIEANDEIEPLDGERRLEVAPGAGTCWEGIDSTAELFALAVGVR